MRPTRQWWGSHKWPSCHTQDRSRWVSSHSSEGRARHQNTAGESRSLLCMAPSASSFPTVSQHNRISSKYRSFVNLCKKNLVFGFFCDICKYKCWSKNTWKKNGNDDWDSEGTLSQWKIPSLTGHISETRRLVVAISLSGSAVNFSLTKTQNGEADEIQNLFEAQKVPHYVKSQEFTDEYHLISKINQNFSQVQVLSLSVLNVMMDHVIT